MALSNCRTTHPEKGERNGEETSLHSNRAVVRYFLMRAEISFEKTFIVGGTNAQASNITKPGLAAACWCSLVWASPPTVS